MINYGLRVGLTGDIPTEALQWRNDPDIFKWCRQYTLISSQEQHEWLQSLPNNNTVKMFSVINQYEEDIGVCGLTSIDNINQSAEFSLYIAKEYQKEGYGKEALVTLLKHGFMDFNLNRIWGETYKGNPALGMFKSVGLKEEGTLKEAYFRNGKFVDAIRTAMLRSQCGLLDTFLSDHS